MPPSALAVAKCVHGLLQGTVICPGDAGKWLLKCCVWCSVQVFYMLIVYAGISPADCAGISPTNCAGISHADSLCRYFTCWSCRHFTCRSCRYFTCRSCRYFMWWLSRYFTCWLSVQVFHLLIQQDKLEHQGQAVNFGIGQTISIAVRRNYLYEDAFEKLSPDNGMPVSVVHKQCSIDWIYVNLVRSQFFSGIRAITRFCNWYNNNNGIISRAPSSVAQSTWLNQSFFDFLLVISPRPPSRFSPNLPGRWQTGCNRKLFRWWEGFNMSLLLRTQLHKMQRGGQTDYLSKK